MKWKVCGMREKENIEGVSALRPDYLGFIFYSSSKRYAGEVNFELVRQLPIEKKIAVFVNAEKEEIYRIAEKGQFRILQLHGTESPAFCGALKKMGFQIIKAFSLDEHFDFESVEAYKNEVDFVLFDTKGKSYGGNGEAFDWNLLKNYKTQRPIFLSGGIGLDNLRTLLSYLSAHSLNIHCIDVNSKFEIEPGKKDIQKLKEFSTILKKNKDELSGK